MQLYNVMCMKKKQDMCVGCLPCLKSGKFEDTKLDCVGGNCSKCGFDKSWSKGVSTRIFDKLYDENGEEYEETLNVKSKLATDIWKDNVEQRAYEYKETPTIATHTK